MIRSRRLFALVVLGCTTNASMAQQPARAVDERPALPFAGTEMFRLLLHLADFKPTYMGSVGEHINGVPYSDVVYILLGSYSDNNLKYAEQILDGGGAVLFATDQRVGGLWDGNRQFGQPTTSYDGRPVFATRNTPRYQNRDFCPYVIPTRPEEEGFNPNSAKIWNVFHGLDRVAVNQATFIRVPRFTNTIRYPLARYHEDCSVDRNFPQPLEDDNWFAVGGEATQRDFTHFRVLAFADHSVFINGMLTDPELQNFTLAARTVEYLKDKDGQNRRHCIFIENNQQKNRFDDAAYVLQTPLPPLPPLPPLSRYQEKLVDLGNQMIDTMQTNDFMNRSLIRGDAEQQDRQLRRLVGSLLVVAAVYMVFQLLRRLWSVRHPLDAPLPPITGKPTTPDSTNPAGIFDRRQRELFRRDNLFEPARATIREMFEAAGTPTDAGPKLPRIVVTGVVRRPETLRKALADLWRIAHGPPARLTVKRWGDLEPLFVRARRAFDDGKWCFASQ